ncbi:MAG: tRNA-dihydrouridine synthase family protein, partial [Clostridia bacterium]|nr:tRNA-dihydrouridine synthase family protein [Clostridia bacterium]
MIDFREIKVALAPLAGVSDYAFRKICAEHNMKYSVTEMVSAKAMHYKDKKTAELAYIRGDEGNTAVQLFGSEPEIIAEAAQMIAQNTYAHNKGSKIPCAIDINMGCPVHKIVSNGEGSALMKSPELVGKIIRAAVDAQSLPVTVKIRAGWDDKSINAVEIAKIAEYNGASMICVHGRTREEMYISSVRRDIIREVKENVSIPVFANGGIMNAADALDMLEHTHAD